MNLPGVSIQPYEATHVEPLFEAVRESIEDLARWLEWCHAGYSVHDSRAWIQHCIEARSAGSEYNFCITDPAGRLLGGCGLNRVEPGHRVANLGYWVRSTETGRGVATAATRLLVEYAFLNTNLNRLEILASTRNMASQRVAERAGARREAVASSRLFIGGEAHDAAQFAFLRRDFRADPESTE